MTGVHLHGNMMWKVSDKKVVFKEGWYFYRGSFTWKHDVEVSDRKCGLEREVVF